MARKHEAGDIPKADNAFPTTGPRLKDIAKVAGISVSGVSRALNGDPRMSVKTRERIKEIAVRAGYEPVAAARVLRGIARTGQTKPFQGAIGHLLHPHEMVMMQRKEARSLYPWLFEVGNRVNCHGYSLDVLPIAPSSSGNSLKRIVSARGIRGVVISGIHDDHRRLNLAWHQIAAVSLSAAPSVQFLTNLSVPYFQDTYSAVQEVGRRGYKRVGFVMIGNILEQFLAGYETAVHSLRLPVIKTLVSKSGVPAGLAGWIRKNSVDCIVSTTGLELLEALRVGGFSVPRDIGLCCVDDFDAPGLLSGLHQPRVKLASLAVDILHTMIQRNEIGIPDCPMEIHLPSEWSEGTTLSPRRKA